jgi:3-dehydroquinate synthase II
MKDIIVRADVPDDAEARKEYVTEGLESGFSSFILREGDERFESLGRMTVLYTRGGEFADGSVEAVDIGDPEGQERAMSLAGRRKAVVVRTTDWTVIPLENMIARFGGSGTSVYACASDPAEARLFLTTMEKGVDGIIIESPSPSMLRKFKDVTSESPSEALDEVEITSVVPVEMGDRVCVDTCSMMVPGEGMLVGSYSNCLFLVQSESEDNGYVASRPFRVNAGAVHCYARVPGGGTRYLSDVRSGDPVLLCDRDGATRVASVGRCKIEKRPLLMVSATDGSREYSVMLQNAETIKLVTRGGATSVTLLKPGDRVLARLESGGRHFGMAVEESITER